MTDSDNLREDVLEERLREMTARCVQADTEIARLRGALEEYGSHGALCGFWHDMQAYSCTCGFDAALRGEEGA